MASPGNSNKMGEGHEKDWDRRRDKKRSGSPYGSSAKKRSGDRQSTSCSRELVPRYTPVPLAFKTVDPECASEKPPIIFLHGFTASKESWDDILHTVANTTNRKVYAIDARNHGDSTWTRDYNFDCNVDDLILFMDTRKIPKAILCGHSMGGITSIKTALRAPERVEKLIVEDMNVQNLPKDELERCKYLFKMAKQGVKRKKSVGDESVSRIMKGIITDFFEMVGLPKIRKEIVIPKSPEEALKEIKQDMDDCRNLDVVCKALSDPSSLWSDYTGVYEGPALFIYGKLSPFEVGLDEQNIKKLIPNAELIGIEEASHSVRVDKPQEFMEAVLKFLLEE